MPDSGDTSSFAVGTEIAPPPADQERLPLGADQERLPLGAESSVESAVRSDQPSSTNADAPQVAASRLYRTIWRWHFFAGMFAAPIIFVAAVTGMLYVFRMELEPIVYRSRLVVTPLDQRVSYDTQRRAALAAAPAGSQLQFMLVPRAGQADRATAFWMKRSDIDDQQVIYVDPYTGRVTGSMQRGYEFFNVVLTIHRTLFAGTFGRVLVELATCWGIVLAVTGIYLWWPKQNGATQGVWIPRVKGKLYTLLRDAHAVPAIYLGVFVILVMATGLVFTNVWGTGFRAAAWVTGQIPESFFDPPKSTIPAGPASTIAIDHAVAVAREQGFLTHELSVSMPVDETGPIQVSARHATGPSLSGMLYLDQYSGDLLHSTRIEEVPAMSVALLYALPIHQGSVFGLPTKILSFLSALMLCVLAVTGVWMWWRRRPRGTVGVPRRHDSVEIPRWIVVLIIALAVVMPMVGISLSLVLFADWWWQRRKQKRRDLAV